MRWISVGVLYAAVALVTGCGGDAQTYSIDETRAAFAEHGFVLEVPPDLAASTQREGQAILAPPGDATFFVVVGTDSELDDVWPDYERMQTEDSFDARRGNVGVFSDSGVASPHDREKILAALEALPDRDAPVLIAGG